MSGLDPFELGLKLCKLLLQARKLVFYVAKFGAEPSSRWSIFGAVTPQ
jgi:hypothetical protein